MMSSLLQMAPWPPAVEGRAVEVTTSHSAPATARSCRSCVPHRAAAKRVGLIGESGSGKSLTSLAVMGLLPANLRAEGTVHVGSDERNLVDLGSASSRHPGHTRSAMVFQEPMTALNPLMQVGPQIAEAMIVHGTQRDRRAANARALQLLQDVGIPSPAEAAQAYPHQLSGGQRQRVAARHCDGERPRAARVRRAHDRARRHRAEAGARPRARDREAPRHGAALHHARPRRGRRDVRARARDETRARWSNAGSIDQIFTRPQHPYTRGLLAASDLSATDDLGKLFTVATAANYRRVTRSRA